MDCGLTALALVNRQVKDQKKTDDGNYQESLEQLGEEIKSVADFWRYENNVPVDQMSMRESIYLFKKEIKPIWEDRRNVLGGSWTFRVPKSAGKDFWKWVQVMAISETLEGVLEKGKPLFLQTPPPNPSHGAVSL
jgi:hypothetical protein